MPLNITPIENNYDLPGGTYSVWQVSDLADAAYYANGKQSYLYQSRIIDALYLFVPVMEQS